MLCWTARRLVPLSLSCSISFCFCFSRQGRVRARPMRARTHARTGSRCWRCLGSPPLVYYALALCAQVGADLDVMARDAYGMRGDGPTVFAQGEPSTNTQTNTSTNISTNANAHTGAYRLSLSVRVRACVGATTCSQERRWCT